MYIRWSFSKAVRILHGFHLYPVLFGYATYKWYEVANPAKQHWFFLRAFSMSMLVNADANHQVTVPSAIVLQPGMPSRLEVTFRPLLAGEAAAVVSLVAPQLGPLRYGLRLAAAAAPPLRPLSFSAVVGSSQSQVLAPVCPAHDK